MEVDGEENRGGGLSALAEEVEEKQPGSSATMERVAAAKKFIENHYKSHMKTFQERRERY
jgi:serine/threonine kinase 38